VYEVFPLLDPLGDSHCILVKSILKTPIQLLRVHTFQRELQVDWLDDIQVLALVYSILDDP
jgi:hypothetical protein